MNNINFINTPPPDKQLAVYRWYHYSIGLSLALMLALGALTSYYYYELKQEQIIKKQLREVKEQQSILSERITEFAKAQEKVKTQNNKLMSAKNFQPITYLEALAVTIPQDTCLFTADIHKKKKLQLHGYTESADSLKKFMEQLSGTTLVKKIELSSLQPESSNAKQLYKFTLIAQLQTV
ncbi:MAG: PilN domain-containing protein [Candidatus Babeliales bacterium]